MKTFNSKLIFVILQVLDLLTTLGCFHYGAFEANPLTAHFIAALGIFGGLLLSKTLACAAIVPVKRAVWLGNAVYVLVVAWNLFLLSVFGLAHALTS